MAWGPSRRVGSLSTANAGLPWPQAGALQGLLEADKRDLVVLMEPWSAAAQETVNKAEQPMHGIEGGAAGN